MTDPIWPWADLHQSSDWPWLRSVSTSDTLAKRDDYQSTSSMATFVALNNSAVATVEIDSNSEEFWRNFVLPIFEAEEKFECFITDSLDQIMIESIKLDQVLHRSKCFESIQASDDMDIRYAHECLVNKVHPKISKVVSSLFNIQRF